MILLIDNYDSFSYNLVQLIGGLTGGDPEQIRVVRNDVLTVEEILHMAPDKIVLSPGPGRPSEAGICLEVVKELGGRIPILGVCLGHQAICEAYGATVSYAGRLMHGKTSIAHIDESSPLFAGLPGIIRVGRYHSLAAVRETLPECLKVTAQTDDGEIMAVEHVDDPVYGVQFHPESILTPDGPAIVRHFLQL